jgi:hypothetical protein
MDPEDERYKAKVTVLIESVRHHIEDEEGEMFPKIREALGRKRLVEIGEALEAARKTAPTHPHPKAPDTPPGNLIGGPALAIKDRVIDLVDRSKESLPSTAPPPSRSRILAGRRSKSRTGS